MKREDLEDIELDYDDDDSLDESDFEFTEDEKKEIVKQIYVAKAESELDGSVSKKQSSRKKGYIAAIVSSLFLPTLITFFVIGLHSNKLVTKPIHGVIFALIILFVVVLDYGLIKIFLNRKVVKKRKTRKWVKFLYVLFMSCYVVGCTTMLVLLYGPYNKFRDWLVTTAMQTMNHTHYCTWFYNQNEIDEVFSRNYIQEPEGETDENLINTEDNKTKPTEYANEYERAVLEHDEDEAYKIINFKVNGCKAYLAVIYDPSMVHVTATNRVGVMGQYVTTMAKREEAMVAINGAGFHDPNYSSSGGCPKGITISRGKIITNNEYGPTPVGGVIGITKNNKLVLMKNITTAQQAINQGIRDAVSWGPFLVVNGKAAYTKGNGGWGYAARTAIGQRKDGIFLFLVVDSNYNRTKGADMGDVTDIMVKYGAINAANLDGGTSSVMVVNGKLISDPIDASLNHETRPIATAFVATKK